MKRARAFTLVEILVVVVLLGVLAAIVVPAIGRSGTAARESTLASDLSLLRRFILIYKSQHLEIAPGYPTGNPGGPPTEADFKRQATLSSNDVGETRPRGTPGFDYGPYLSMVPANPFNGLATIEMIANGQAFPAAANDSHGWVCKPETGEIRPDNAGADVSGTAYYDY